MGQTAPLVTHRMADALWWVAAMLGWLLTSVLAMTARVPVEDLQLRKDSPIPIEVILSQAPSQEGRLEATLLQGTESVGVHRSPMLVLTGGSRAVPLLLTPPASTDGSDAMAVRLRWLPVNGETLDLGTHPLGRYNLVGEELILAVPRTARRLSAVEAARIQSLRIESVRPRIDEQSLVWPLASLVSSPPAENMPEHPAGWCAYDVVALDAAAWAALNTRQINALVRWVHGGGALWLEAKDESSERQQTFATGLKVRSHESIAGITFIYLGLGRVVWNTRPLRAAEPGREAQQFSDARWRASVAWLWGMREHIVVEITKKNGWKMEESSDGWWRRDEDLEWIWNAAAGFGPLTPGAPKMIPLALMALLLGSLLLLVGPADWLVLGALRKRRWTWVFFPALCGMATWIMAGIAATHLGHEDRHGSVRIVDLTHNGKVAREIRYELLMPARDRVWHLDLQNSTATLMPRLATQSTGQNSSALPVPTSEWSRNGRLRMSIPQRQWTPTLVCITQFPENQKDDSGIVWNAWDRIPLDIPELQEKIDPHRRYTLATAHHSDTSQNQVYSRLEPTNDYSPMHLLASLSPGRAHWYYYRRRPLGLNDVSPFIVASRQVGTHLTIYRHGARGTR